MSKIRKLTLAAALIGIGIPAHADPKPVMQPSARGKIVVMDPALDALIAPDARLEKIATGFVFLEGPMWREGAVWCSDLRGNKMYKVTPDGKVTVMLEHAGGLKSFPAGANLGSNAMVTGKGGAILMEQVGARRIARLDGAMHITNVLDKFEGKRLNGPNDMVFAHDGALWFTDPPYGFTDPAHPDKDPDKAARKELSFNGVFRYQNGKLAARIRDLARPNGIAFSPDGKLLYISNTENTPAIYRYRVAADGHVSDRQTFLDLSKEGGIGVPDGLRVDSHGNVWATGPGGIRIISPTGKVLGQIRLPEVAANLTWGGPDLKTLYIMASSSIYRLSVRVPGEKPLYVR